MKISWRILASLLVMLFAVNCSAPVPVKAESSDYGFLEKGQFMKSFQRLDPSDGIDRSEACLLGYAYFTKFEGSCGFAELDSQTSKDWIFRTAVGSNGFPGPDIKVSKKTGVVRNKDHRSVSPPWKELSDYFEVIMR